jgi:transcriptional regulator with XRE-family HTH domain
MLLRKIRLKRLRESTHLTQLKLGEAIGMSPDIISAWERGKRYPSHKNGKRLKEFFNAPSLEWLMSEDSTEL